MEDKVTSSATKPKLPSTEETKDASISQEERTPQQPGKGVKRRNVSPTPSTCTTTTTSPSSTAGFVTPSKERDDSKPSSAKKRRKSASSSLTLSKISSPSSTFNPAAMTERQQMAYLLQMTDPQKKTEDTPMKESHMTPSRIHKRNERGETPLHIACIRGDLHLAASLIEQGAEVNARDHAGWTPLHEACNHGHPEVVRLLLGSGAGVNTQGMGGDTPLHDATINNHTEVVKLLMEHGSDPNLANEKEQTSLDVCSSQEILHLLTGTAAKTTPTVLQSDGNEDQSTEMPVPPHEKGEGVQFSESEKQTEEETLSEEDSAFLPEPILTSQHTETTPAQSSVSASSSAAVGETTQQQQVTATPSRTKRRSKRERGLGARVFSDISSSESDSELMMMGRKVPRLMDRLPASVSEESDGDVRQEEEEGDTGEGERVEVETGGGLVVGGGEGDSGEGGRGPAKGEGEGQGGEGGKDQVEGDVGGGDFVDVGDDGECRREGVVEKEGDGECGDRGRGKVEGDLGGGVVKGESREHVGVEEKVKLEDDGVAGVVERSEGVMEKERSSPLQFEHCDTKVVAGQEGGNLRQITAEGDLMAADTFRDPHKLPAVMVTELPRSCEDSDLCQHSTEQHDIELSIEKTHQHSECTHEDGSKEDQRVEPDDVTNEASTRVPSELAESAACDSLKVEGDEKKGESRKEDVWRVSEPTNLVLSIPFHHIKFKRGRGKSPSLLKVVRVSSKDRVPHETSMLVEHGRVESVSSNLLRGGSQRTDSGPTAKVVEKIDTSPSLEVRSEGSRMTMSEKHVKHGERKTHPMIKKVGGRGGERGGEGEGVGERGGWSDVEDGVDLGWEATPQVATSGVSGSKGLVRSIKDAAGGREGGVIPGRIIEEPGSCASPTPSRGRDSDEEDEGADDSDSSSGTVVSLSTSLPIVFSGLQHGMPPKPSPLVSTTACGAISTSADGTTTDSVDITGGQLAASGGMDSGSADRDAAVAPQNLTDTRARSGVAALSEDGITSRPTPAASQVKDYEPGVDESMQVVNITPPKPRSRQVLRSAVVQHRREQAGSIPVSSHLPSFLLTTQHTRQPPPPSNPKVVYPPIHLTMYKLFSEQEMERVQLHSVHLTEQDRLLQCMEQELVRAHQRASRHCPTISVCAVLLERLLPRAEAIGEDRTPDGDIPEGGQSLDERLLISLVQDVWDKFCSQRTLLLARQRHEAEAMWMMQYQQWTERLRDLGFSHQINFPTIHVPKLFC